MTHIAFILFSFIVVLCIHSVFTQYKFVGIRPSFNGFEIDLDLIQSQSDLSTPVKKLRFTTHFWKDTVLRFTIKDRERERWEVPEVVLPPQRDIGKLQYDMNFTYDPFTFSITRKSDKVTIFNMTKLIYNEQYIELENSIPNDGKSHIYGFGERVHNFRMDSSGKTYTLFSFDHGTPVDEPTYGSHPFHMQYYKGKFHGGFMLNSNAMDVTLENSKIIYKMIGGIVDLFTFVGPSSEEVMQQYHRTVVGTPKMVPFWALGNHQCRWGYKTIDDLENVVNTYESLGIPIDTAWSDIDWMEGYKVFVPHPQNYPVPKVQSFIDRLKKKDRHYVVILDPGIKIEKGYRTYEEGLQADVFIKSAETGKDLVGKVWPGYTLFPDFTKKSTFQWWQKQIARFIEEIPVSGLWIDMNEVASFVDGECIYYGEDRCDSRPAPQKREGFDPNYPPYRPGNSPLTSHAISSDAIYNSSIDYNLHTLYGYNEARATMPALEAATGKRGLVISRSTFGGSGRYAQHWLGDNRSSWSDLFYSISGILSFQMYGIPFAGVDICGFQGDSNAELCGRWVQVGAFYPFTRNHNDEQSAPQEYYRFGDKVISIARSSLLTKYSLLSFYYTLLKKVSDNGGSVLRPIVFEFPNEKHEDIPYLDRQFMVGSSLLVSPVLEAGQNSVYAYVPGGATENWFDFFSGEEIKPRGWATFDAPFEKINVFIRGGHAILTHAVVEGKTTTTAQARRDGFRLIIAQDANNHATGTTYIDDGDAIVPLDWMNVVYSHKRVSSNTFDIQSSAMVTGSVTNINTALTSLIVYGVTGNVLSVRANSQAISSFTFNQDTRVLIIDLMSANVDIRNATISYEVAN